MARTLWVGSVAAVVVLGMGAVAVGRDFRRVRILDRCEPESFNAAVGPGTCIGDREVTFADFLAELVAEQSVEKWSFDSEEVHVKPGEPIKLENRGGETHTWTEVAQFGGGFVDVLNGPSGTPVPAPECAAVNPDGTLRPMPPSATNVFVLAQSEQLAAPLPKGKHLIQCCIHPWMRMVVDVR
jgi:plastocyanin